MTKEKTQRQKFRELVREAECDEDEAAFDKKLKKIAKQPSAPKSKKTPQ